MRRTCCRYVDSSWSACFCNLKRKKEGKSLSVSDLVTNLGSTKKPCMHSFLMLGGWYNESRHKSRALSNCLTCINNTEPWQGKLVLNVLCPPPPPPSLFFLFFSLALSAQLQASPLSFWGQMGECYNPSALPKSTSLWENKSKKLLKVTLNSLNWLPCLQQRQEVIWGHDKKLCVQLY